MRFFDLLRNATRPGASGAGPYLVSFLLVLGCFLVRAGLAPFLAGRTPLLPFVAAVVVAAGLYGAGPGLLAIVLSIAISSVMFMGPNVDSPAAPDQLVSILVFGVTSAAMLVFANHLRNARRRALLLEVELREVQSTAAMSTMAGTLAHELNQPLTAASNYVAACRRFAGALEESARPLVNGLEQAEAQIQRAGSIIREARALVRNVPVERKTASLRQIFERVIEVARASEAGGDVRFQIAIGRGVAQVHVNVVQIEQVLLNLVRNSCQAMRDDPEATILFQARQAEKGSIIEVRDSGPGIPPDRLPGLFSAARGSTGSGLGVGLSISRTIVEAHGGSIMAQNSPEGGAAFFIFLPDEEEAD
ncbi:MAG TPA: ATP-binding protein [Sphingomicrobium sp.]|nr:ATP-binding protein [Sphingomicrobium sp.]